NLLRCLMCLLVLHVFLLLFDEIHHKIHQLIRNGNRFHDDACNLLREIIEATQDAAQVRDREHHLVQHHNDHDSDQCVEKHHDLFERESHGGVLGITVESTVFVIFWQ